MPRIAKIDDTALDALSAQAAASPRRRKNLNLHQTLDDPVQRFCNAFQPGTYVRPHRHVDKWELFVWLRGAAGVLTFDDAGRVTDRAELSESSGVRVVEIPAATWHSLVALEQGSVLFETKRGPYDASASGAQYAPWAPAENDERAASFERWLRTARAGDSFIWSGD